LVLQCSDVLEDCTATNFTVTEMVALKAEMIEGLKCVSCIGQFEGVKAVTAVEVVQRQRNCPKAV
jgi:hypothetical protein